MWLIDRGQMRKCLMSVVSESFPHLKRGAIRDFLNIMDANQYYDPKAWNKTDYTYTFPTGAKLEFFSVDQPGKVRGPRRDILFVNEANNISFETYTQLDVRTREIIWLDWNPVAEFWWYDEIAPKLEHDFLRLTYKDNEALEETIINAIEARRMNKNWWRVYGLGLLGEVEGKVYTDWAIIDEIPQEARLLRYGLDFGYTNHPTAIVAIYEYNNGFILDEITYQTGLKNRQIADIMNNLPKAPIIADSAEPKSIDEIGEHGLTVLPSKKGRDSINQGIQFVQDQRISMTKRSLNIIKEYRNYLWQEDKDGKTINEPSDIFNHSMDAIRYGIASSERVHEWKPSDPGGVKPLIPGTLA